MEAGRWRAIAIAALLVVSTISTSVSFLRPVRAQGETDLVAAVQAEVAGEFGVPAGTIIVTVMTEQGAWAYGTGVVSASGEDGTPRTRFFLAHRAGGVWTVALRYTAAFDALLAQAPAEFPSPTIRAALEGFSAAADGSSQLSFPFSTGETWYFLGPHPSTTEVWASLDFSPVFSDSSGAPVLAMRGGVIFRPCANMIMIDHGDGWTTGYYHVININVGNGQIVTRGQKIGGISDQVQCGGFAGGPHVHVWVEFLGQPVAIAGRDIGGWTVENGTQPYEGCLVRGATRRCTSDITNQVTNDGEIGSGGSPALVTMEFLYGEVGLAVPYQIGSFPANSSVAISWRRPGGSVVNLGSVNTNAGGTASGNITVPPTEGGWKNSIRFTVGSLTRTVFFNVFPSLSVEPDVAGPGEPITVTLRGFAKQSQVTVAYIPESTFEPVAMGMVMTNNTGGATANLMLPADLANGPGIVEATLGETVAVDDLRVADGPVVWLGATTVRAGSEADYWVARFPADTLLTLKMTAVVSDDVVATLDTVTTDANGEANGTFELPLLPFGMWRVIADTGTVAAEVVVTIAPALYPPLTPVERGSSVDITALGYTANSLVTILWVNDQGNIPIGSGQADAQGSATVAVTVPPVPDGTITLRGQDETGVSSFSHLDVLGGPLPGPPAVAVTPNRSTVNNSVTYTLSNFPPSSAVQIRWRRTSGSLIDLGTVQTAANGTASGQIQVPATTGGANQQIRFISGAASATALFEVVPRIKVTPSPVERVQQVSISLRGYGKQEAIRIRWKQGNTWVQVGLVTTSNTGSANASVTVPAWVPDGMTAIRGDGPLFRAQTNAVEVSGGIFTPAEAPATPTASVTPTPNATTIPSPTASPEPTISPTVTAEPATPSPTPEPTATSTAEPTVTPDPSTPGPEATTGVGNDGP